MSVFILLQVDASLLIDDDWHAKKIITIQRKCMILRKQSNKFSHETKGKCKEKDDINYKICDIFSQVILDQKWTVSGEKYNVQCNRKWHTG